MHIVILAGGQNDALSVQHLHHRTHAPEKPASRFIDLLILDARHMSPACLGAATAKVVELRNSQGLRHGVLLCTKPELPLVVASIRCGLRDVINQYIDAVHLRQLLRAAVPGLTRRDYRDAVGFLRIFNAFSSREGGSVPLARRAEELGRLAEKLAEQEKTIEAEKDRLARLEQDLRERTRRLDRQIARMQNDADVASPTAAGPSPDQEAMAQRLEKRATELDVREKLLNEIQALLLSTPQAAALGLKTPASGGGAGSKT